MFVANVDWPDNNCKAYRWYSSIDDYSGVGTDGKWRFLLYDLDLSMWRLPETNYASPSLALTLGLENNGWRQEFSLLKGLLKREDIREQFAAIVEEYAKGAFSPEHAEAAIDAIEAEMQQEMTAQIAVVAKKEAEKTGDIFETVYEEKQEQHEQEIQNIREFWQHRADFMRQEIEKLPDYMAQLPD